MCINFNYYLLFILHAFTCTVAYFIFIKGCRLIYTRIAQYAYDPSSLQDPKIPEFDRLPGIIVQQATKY